jgi:hypothetical protein
MNILLRTIYQFKNTPTLFAFGQYSSVSLSDLLLRKQQKLEKIGLTQQGHMALLTSFMNCFLLVFFHAQKTYCTEKNNRISKYYILRGAINNFYFYFLAIF